MPDPSTGARGRRSLPKDDVGAGARMCELRPPSVSEASRAPDRQSGPVQDMGVDHGGRDIRVSEELLHGPDVIACLQEMGGKGVDAP